MEKFESPRIALFNCSDNIYQGLSDLYSNIAIGNLGIPKTIDYEHAYYKNTCYINLDYFCPENIHEFEIVIIDLQNNLEPCIVSDEEPNNNLAENKLFKIYYPEQNFNPTPYVLDLLKNKYSNKCLRIIFAGTNSKVNYCTCTIIGKNTYSVSSESKSYTTYDTIDTIDIVTVNKSGKIIKQLDSNLYKKLTQYFNNYNVTFVLPEIGEYTSIYSLRKKYLPIAFNGNDECISYISCYENKIDLILPVCRNQLELLKYLLSDLLPDMYPTFFPETQQKSWLKNDLYKTSEILELDKQKEELFKKYKKDEQEIEKMISKKEEKNRFLIDLLTETGTNLVKSTKKYLEWLGFTNIKEMDDEKDTCFREDLQIKMDNNLLIIEVKGIGGTSTDADCVQISKHRRKREKEYGRDTTVYPLYIVNHQRHMNPELRQNPPFTKDQISYAKEDERGLITTYSLFKQYRFIENGIFTKEETRNALLNIGLIDLIPNDLLEIGEVTEYFSKNNACIINIKNSIKCNDTVLCEKNGDWIKATINSIQLNDAKVETTDTGECGIVFDRIIKKGYKIYKRQ